VAAWMVHALAGHHDVSTLTLGDWSPAETNAFYGTAIAPTAVHREVVPAPYRWLSGLPDDYLTRLRMCLVLHDARPRAAQYDLMISGDNFAAFAKPGIQYVYFPARLQPPAARWKLIVDVYFALCDRLLGAPWTDAARNTTLVTSQWTAAGLRRLGQVSNPIVLYPPVLDPGPGLPWQDRDDSFLCVGRFHYSKRIETSIAIVKMIRDTVLPEARLIIVGSAVDPAYTARLRSIAVREGDWIQFREDLSREALNALMGRSRYGIQAMEGEHFGMATAEMARAGCVVFAHNSGGSPEVLNQPSLLWRTAEEAIGGIDAVVAGKRGEQLSAQLRQHAARFSAETFVERFRSIVSDAQVS